MVLRISQRCGLFIVCVLYGWPGYLWETTFLLCPTRGAGCKSLIWPEGQMVARRAHCAKGAPSAGIINNKEVENSKCFSGMEKDQST